MTEKSQYAYDAVKEVTESSSSTSPQYHINQDHFAALPAQDWPQEPVTLLPDRTQSFFNFAYDVALIIIPVLLMVKTGLVILACRLDKDNHGDTVSNVHPMTTILIEVNGQLVTIFTIVFVTIVSTLVRRYALYKAQNGAYLSQLEQLHGSISLPSTLKLIVNLKAFSSLSVGLVILWCFQYLGSQSNKYEYRLVPSDRFRKIAIDIQGNLTPTVFDPVDPSVLENNSWVFDISARNRRAANVFSVTAVGQVDKRIAGMDIYGDPLIPNLAMMSDPVAKMTRLDQDEQGWYSVLRQPSVSSPILYINYVGLHFSLRREPNHNGSRVSSWAKYLGDYSFSSSYLNCTCATPVIRPFTDFPEGTLVNQSVSFNMTSINGSEPRDAFGKPLRSFEFWMRWNESYNDTANSAVTVCNITRINYDAQVNCQDTGCLIHKMRWRNGGSFESALSYSTPLDRDEVAAAFLDNMLRLNGDQPALNRPTDVVEDLSSHMMSIVNPNSEDHPYYTSEDYTPSMSTLNTQLLSKGFNTYYTITQLDYIGDSGAGGQAEFIGSEYDPHYAIWPAFIATDFASSLVLLAAAVISIVLRLRTVAPDVLGSVSSLTRDNPYLGLPASGTALDGISRARMLRRVKVRLGDVSARDEEVGRIALARVDTGTANVRSLTKTTHYI